MRLIQTPVHILVLDSPFAAHVALGTDPARRAKHFYRIINNVDDVLSTNVEVNVAILAVALDAKPAMAILLNLVLGPNGILNLVFGRLNAELYLLNELSTVGD